jgi:8-oxo-dGTP diphosphatase
MRSRWQFISTVLGIIFRHPVTGVTIIPVLPSGEIVLIRRRDTGQWGLAGGVVDWGENIPTAARRELKEETGLELVQIIRLVGVYSAADRDPRLHSISISLAVKAQGQFRVEDDLEISDVKAFAPMDLPLDNLSHDHGQQLKNYLQGLTVVD